MPIPTIETLRLILRPFYENDAQSLYNILQEEGVLRYFPNPTPPALEKAAKVISDQLEQWQRYGYAWWAVTLKSDHTFIGWCGLQFLPETNETEVGYLLGKPWWGKGYATEAAATSLQYAFTQLNMKQIIALVHPENKASIRVIEKLGMDFVDATQYFGMNILRYIIEKDRYLDDTSIGESR